MDSGDSVRPPSYRPIGGPAGGPFGVYGPIRILDTERPERAIERPYGGGCAIILSLFVRSTLGDSRVANLVRLSLGASFLPPNHLPNPLEYLLMTPIKSRLCC